MLCRIFAVLALAPLFLVRGSPVEARQATSVFVNFSSFPTKIPTVPINVYEGVIWHSISYANARPITPTGLTPTSVYDYAQYSFIDRTNEGPGPGFNLLPVSPSQPYKSFEFTSFCFGCTVGTGVANTNPAVSCRLRIVGTKKDGGSATITTNYSATGSLRSPLTCVEIARIAPPGESFTDLVDVSFFPGSDLLQGEFIGLGIDNVQYTLKK